jgi:hypothetical protein
MDSEGNKPNSSIRVSVTVMSQSHIFKSRATEFESDEYKSWRDCKMPCRSKKEKYECCGKTFESKEEYEAHMKSHGCCH